MKLKLSRVICLFALPLCGLAQSDHTPATPASLPPEAQAAVHKGTLAAKKQEWESAIQSFQEARKTAPNAPQVFYNLGVAESKIPGRELRAIAWFGAYFAAVTNAGNAEAVADAITKLQIKNQANVNRLINAAQEAAENLSEIDDSVLLSLVRLWAGAGDIGAAVRAADLIQHSEARERAQCLIAVTRANEGDTIGALRAADLIQTLYFQCVVKQQIVVDQLVAADLVGCQKTLVSILRSVDLIQDADQKRQAQEDLSIPDRALLGQLTNTPNQNLPEIVAYQVSIRLGLTPVITNWVDMLDDRSENHDCALNSKPFLDLPSLLGSLHSDNPTNLFSLLKDTAQRIVAAKKIIDRMLREQARQQPELRASLSVQAAAKRTSILAQEDPFAPERSDCINNLRLIDSAKQQWALEHRKQDTDTPTKQDLQPYIGQGPNGELPVCPDRGVYTFGIVGEYPTCNIPGHALPKALSNNEPFQPSPLSNTGEGGNRPIPPYPKLAEALGQQGAVELILTADESGGVTSVDVKQSSGSYILDHSTVDFVKRNWTVSPGVRGRLFQTSISYTLNGSESFNPDSAIRNPAPPVTKTDSPMGPVRITGSVGHRF